LEATASNVTRGVLQCATGGGRVHRSMGPRRRP
jgi:hypothetical protein